MMIYEFQHENEERTKRVLARIESLLSAENADRLRLYLALKGGYDGYKIKESA